MPHFGVLPLKGAGHLNPLIALSRQLVARGHRVTFIQSPELEQQIRQHGFEFLSVGTFTPNNHSVASGQHKPSSGIGTLLYRIRRTVGDMEKILQEAPLALTHIDVDALILDEIALAGPTLAEMLRLPYFVISTSVPHNFGWSAPPRIAPPISCLARVQKALLEVSVLRMRGPVRWKLNKFRRSVGLSSVRDIKKSFPELAHITQLPECLDFPRSNVPRNFYYTGPFLDEAARQSVEFPWDRLDGRPIAYASLGTTLKGEPGTFYMIAEACDGLDLQLVISLGGRRNPEKFDDLPGKPLVVKDAPQLELLKRAEIVITHAGPNTAFETLLNGRPMVALPKAFDQPAIATRLERLGVAEVLRVKDLSSWKIRVALKKILTNSNYRIAAVELQTKIRSARGLERASDIIEKTLEKHTSRQTKTHRSNSISVNTGISQHLDDLRLTSS
jgi:zeaxanthin glucosyltransferase